VRTIAFVPPADNERFAGLGGLAPLQVTNPLSAELSEMRRSLQPGLLSAMRFNLNREADALHIFEVGKVFGTLDGNPTEGERLAGLSYGDYAMGAVGQPAIKASFSSLKGVVETCLRTFGILGQVRFEPRSDSSTSCLHPGRSAAIVLDAAQLGVLGEIHPSEALRLGVSDRCVLFELDSRQLLAYVSQPRPAVSSPPKFPAIRRDLALVVDGGVVAANVLGAVSESSSPLLESVELFDVYEGEPIPSGKKSVALACRYRSKDRTLTDDEVNRAHAMVVEHAKTRLGAQLRQ